MREAGIVCKDELLPPELKPEVPPDGYESLAAGPDGVSIVRYEGRKPKVVKVLYDAKKQAAWS